MTALPNSAAAQVLSLASRNVVAEKRGAASPDGSTKDSKDPVRTLIRSMMGTYALIHSAGRAYAVPRNGPRVAVPFGAPLRREVVRLADVELGRAIGRDITERTLLGMEAYAHEGAETPLALRFAHDPAAGRIVLDLGPDKANSAHRFATVTAGGWTVGAAPPEVTFRRTPRTRPLPVPAQGGALLELAGVLSLDPAGDVFRLLVGWVLGLPFAAGPRPGLLLTGQYGSGKSTRLRLAASLVEPTAVDGLGAHFGVNGHDDQVRALHRAVPIWDNLHGVSRATSDDLCRMVTGSAREGRQLYSNDELSASEEIMRPVGLTALDVPAGLQPDALDRLVVVEVPPIGSRVPDDRVQDAFDAAHPRLLGALLDAVAAALRWGGHVVVPGNPRMASYARVLAAVDAAAAAGELPGMPLGLLVAFTEQSRATRARSAVDDTFGSALVALLEHAPGHVWAGSAAELLTHCAVAATGGTFGVAGWPRSARAVPGALEQLRQGLAAVGVTWERHRDPKTKNYRYSFTLGDESEGS